VGEGGRRCENAWGGCPGKLPWIGGSTREGCHWLKPHATPLPSGPSQIGGPVAARGTTRLSDTYHPAVYRGEFHPPPQPARSNTSGAPPKRPMRPCLGTTCREAGHNRLRRLFIPDEERTLLDGGRGGGRGSRAVGQDLPAPLAGLVCWFTWRSQGPTNH
jgi:hypothetical protein